MGLIFNRNKKPEVANTSPRDQSSASEPAAEQSDTV